MKFSFKVVSKMTLDHHKGENRSKLECSEFFLEVSDNLNFQTYIDEKGLPTKEGSHAVTLTLIAALSANVSLAHQKGWRKDYEHMNYIVQELTKMFADPSEAEVEEGFMD